MSCGLGLKPSGEACFFMTILYYYVRQESTMILISAAETKGLNKRRSRLSSALCVALLLLAGCAAHRRTAQTPSVQANIPNQPSPHCHSVAGLPDATCTPGVVQTTDLNVICHTSTKDRRPAASYTTALKKAQITEYGWQDTSPQSYEEDHLISLELGGDPIDPKNLWPEPHVGQFNSGEKDRIENWLHKQVCVNGMSIIDAQRGIAENWKQYLGALNLP